VIVTLSSSDTSEGSAGPGTLTFTPAAWNVPQTVTVTGTNDAIADGPVAYAVQFGAATSADLNFDGLEPADVSVTNTDDGDASGVTVTPGAGTTTSEGGGTATFTVVLTSEPLAEVTITLASSDITEATVSPGALTFTAATWNVRRR